MPENNIRFIRVRKGISQAALARAVGVSQQAVAKWENGSLSLESEHIPKIAKALGVHKGNLFPGPGPEEAMKEIVDLITPIELIVHFRSDRPSYYARLAGAAHNKLMSVLDFPEMNTIWFETIDNMIVAINRNQVRALEIGRDLGSYPEKMIPPQTLAEVLESDGDEGESDLRVIDQDETETYREPSEDGDERVVRLFVKGFAEPFVCAPDPDDQGETLMEVLSMALEDLVPAPDLFTFEYDDDNDQRTIFFKRDCFELIEAPNAAYKEYQANFDE